MKKDLLIAVVAVLLVAVTTFALNTVRGDVPMTPSRPHQPGEKGARTAKAKGGGKAVMHINGDPITQQEFEAFLEQAPEQSREFYASPAGRRALADELIKLKLLEQEGRKMGIENDPEVARQLETNRAQIIAGRALQKIISETNDARLRAAYQEEVRHLVDLRHIVFAYQGGQLPPREGKPAPTAEQATERARAVVAQLRAGAKFDDVVKSVSDDPQAAERGGRIGVVPRQQLQELGPEVAAAVNQLQPGQISDPVRTPYGIHIFQANPPAFEELRPQLAQRMQRELLDETMARLTAQSKIDLDPQYFPQQQANPQLRPEGVGGQPPPRGDG